MVKQNTIDKQGIVYAFENQPDWCQKILFDANGPNSGRGKSFLLSSTPLACYKSTCLGSAGELVQTDCLAYKEPLKETPGCAGLSSADAGKSHTLPATCSRTVVSKWHSCAICLEEMMDTELLTHLKCGTLICHSCLEASRQHCSSSDGNSCPVRVRKF